MDKSPLSSSMSTGPHSLWLLLDLFSKASLATKAEQLINLKLESEFVAMQFANRKGCNLEYTSCSASVQGLN